MLVLRARAHLEALTQGVDLNAFNGVRSIGAIHGHGAGRRMSPILQSSSEALDRGLGSGVASPRSSIGRASADSMGILSPLRCPEVACCRHWVGENREVGAAFRMDAKPDAAPATVDGRLMAFGHWALRISATVQDLAWEGMCRFREPGDRPESGVCDRAVGPATR